MHAVRFMRRATERPIVLGFMGGYHGEAGVAGALGAEASELSRGYRALVLGAWGCGAFGNDPRHTAQDFRHALETQYGGAFDTVVFAVTDWSTERRFLGPFRDVFGADVEPYDA